jgi:hypothetical protein
MTNPEIARAIRQASLALPTNHPVQPALDAAHGALLSTAAVATSREEAAQPLGRESR